MIAYKLKETQNQLEKGRLFFELDTQVVLIATCTEPQQFFFNYTFKRLKENGLLEEIDLLKETKIHPHLYKPIKELLNNNLKQL